jgi:hypothetical protein
MNIKIFKGSWKGRDRRARELKTHCERARPTQSHEEATIAPTGMARMAPPNSPPTIESVLKKPVRSLRCSGTRVGAIIAAEQPVYPVEIPRTAGPMGKVSGKATHDKHFFEHTYCDSALRGSNRSKIRIVRGNHRSTHTEQTHLGRTDLRTRPDTHETRRPK